MKPRLVVVTHGMLAVEILKSAEMIVGAIDDAFPFCLTAEKGIDALKAEVGKLMESTPADVPVLFMTDLPGGTPCNVAVEILYGREGVVVLTGLNLMMLVEFALSSEADVRAVADRVLTASTGSVKEIKKEAASSEEGYED